MDTAQHGKDDAMNGRTLMNGLARTGAARILGLAIATMIAGAARAEIVPIAVTGFTQDMVVGPGETFAGGITATMDGGTTLEGATWYSLGQNPDAPNTGLPMGTTQDSWAAPDTTFTLQPDDANNALLIDSDHAGTLTLTLATPGRYESLSFFGSTGNGNNTVAFLLHFADGSQKLGAAIFADWFYNDPVAYAADGRITPDGYDSVGAFYPAIYQVNIGAIDSSVALTSIDFAYGFGGGHTAIFAVSGQAVPAPEPSSVILLGLGGVGIAVGHVRRRRGRPRATSGGI